MHPFAHMTVEISALQEVKSNCKGRFSMRLLNPFGRARAFAEARSLHDCVVAVARSEALYGPDRAPDTLQGRLELLTVHAALCFLRLRAEPDARALAQSFADILFRALDAGLREAGVGDLTVPKKMRGIAKRFYGRLEAYAAALKPDAPPEALEAALARIIWGAPAHPFTGPLAGHLRRLHHRLLETPLNALVQPAIWAQPVLQDG